MEKGAKVRGGVCRVYWLVAEKLDLDSGVVVRNGCVQWCSSTSGSVSAERVGFMDIAS